MKSSPMSRRIRRWSSVVVSLAASLIIIPADAGAAPAGPTGPLAGQMVEILAQQPGGVQVSDNALAWEGGHMVVVLPASGERVAPTGLGSNPRVSEARSMGLEELVDPVGVQDVHGCPSGITVPDNYCFYDDLHFHGSRWQFSETCSSDAANWGFASRTSSWVNTDTDKTIHARDGLSILWNEPENSVSTYVGDHNNDRMKSWTCS